MTEIKNEVKEIKIERTEGQKLGMALRNLDGKLCVTKVSEGGAVQVRVRGLLLASFFFNDEVHRGKIFVFL